jgi:hypothetical protein
MGYIIILRKSVVSRFVKESDSAKVAPCSTSFHVPVTQASDDEDSR